MATKNKELPLRKTVKTGSLTPETTKIAKDLGDIPEHDLFNRPTED